MYIVNREQFINYVETYLYSALQEFKHTVPEAEKIIKTIYTMGSVINSELAELHSFDKDVSKLEATLLMHTSNFNSKERIKTCLGIINRSKFVCALSALCTMKKFGVRRDLMSSKLFWFHNGFTEYRLTYSSSSRFEECSIFHIKKYLWRLIKLQAKISKFGNSTFVRVGHRLADSATIYTFDGNKSVKIYPSLLKHELVIDYRLLDQVGGDHSHIVELIQKLLENLDLKCTKSNKGVSHYEISRKVGPLFYHSRDIISYERLRAITNNLMHNFDGKNWIKMSKSESTEKQTSTNPEANAVSQNDSLKIK